MLASGDQLHVHISGAKHHQICNNAVNLSPAVALARSSIYHPTILPDAIDLYIACHDPSIPDAFNLLSTLYVLYTYVV